MMDTALFFLHHTLTLLGGVVLSAAFCGVQYSKKNAFLVLAIFLACGASLLSAYLLLGEQLVWELYPLIVHALLGLLLCIIFKKHIVTVIGSIALAYLCCQPSKWFGLMTALFTSSESIILCVRICITIATVLVSLYFLASLISEIYNKDLRVKLLFSSVPLVYYIFDYVVSIYANLQDDHFRVASEFLAFFLFIVFTVFVIVYYREYEKKMHTQRKNQIIEIKVQQQAKELEAIRKSNLETSLLRHDMRLLLSNLAMSLEENDKESARKLISGYISEIEATALHRYCENDTVNYVLTNYESKCQKAGILFQVDLELESLSIDEIMFSSILSNALDNAMNAQVDLPEQERHIKVLLKNFAGKLLLSVKNPFVTPPDWDCISQLPVTLKEGHGYGTQSILYMTEKLGGKCQFSVQDNLFVLRIIL